MVVKVFLATALVVALALLSLAYLTSREEVETLKQATNQAAQQIADLVVGSVEHAMREGDGVKVKELIAGFRERVTDASILIYDRRGLQVFGDKPPAPPPASWPAPFAEVARSGARTVADGRVWRPIANEERCHECHEPDAMLRGVLAFERDDAAIGARREALVSQLVHAGFVQVMTARQARHLDDYFAEIVARAPTIQGIAVYDSEGDLAFGKDIAGLPETELRAALAPGAVQTTVTLRGGAAAQLVPLPWEKRCGNCHKDQARHPVRGVLAIALADAPAGDRSIDQELEVVVDSSLRATMMSSLGRIIADYLREVVASGAVKSLELYDAEGRVWFTSRPPAPDASVQAALAAETIAPMLVGHGRTERVVMTRRLDNKPACTSCHGDDHEVRGAVMVSLPNDKALMVRQAAISRTAVLSLVALSLVAAVVFLLLRVFVHRPVREIDTVATAVGDGDLSVRVASADPDGDELRRLGARMNDMIQGLRTKFVLEKFVSRGAAAAAAAGADRGSRFDLPATGVRRHMTILFSDIRGFTAFSETVAPEEVVEMLNRFLRAQADVVDKWQGDVDKFVGDEVMAVFHGPDAARRAVRCGVEMVEAVEKLRGPRADLAVGVGVSTGDVVYGPIGSGRRLDFTVIGDVVNTGARLCSAAAGGQVIVARAVLDDCQCGLGDVEFNPLEPIKVKNKREPLEVYSATRVKT
jgi:adenylate cyclase